MRAFERITEESRRFSVRACVCVSMNKCKVRPGGPDSALFVMYKGEELGESTWAFVSISGKTDGEDLKYYLAVLLFLT